MVARSRLTGLQRIGSLATILLMVPIQWVPPAQSAQPTDISTACKGAELLPPDNVDVRTLRSLIQRYRVSIPEIAGIGDRPLTRYEFAAALNVVIEKIQELLTAGAVAPTQVQLLTIHRLQEKYAAELATLRGRVDALETRTATLEKQPFSTTTQLSGATLFQITGRGGLPGQVTSQDSVKLSTGTAISGRDRLRTRLAPPAPAPPAAPTPAPTGTMRTTFSFGTESVPNLGLNGGLSPQERIHQPGTGNTEGYQPISENPFLQPSTNPRSTFAIDVDTASYSNVRRFINQGKLPPKDAVRIEEMINYFPYDYPQPTGDKPFSITTDVAAAVWNPKHKLVQIGLKGKQLQTVQPSNLVFLVDVSGSMTPPNKLPLVKQSLCLLVNELSARDRVTLVVYAGKAGLVLPPTLGSEKAKIMDAIDRLQAGGSTAGGAGIELAYKMAQQNLLPNGNNRVILATDGDFNVGVSSDGELVRLIEQKRDQGIFLTVLGYGYGNYKDSKMEQLADKGNGNYAYIDTFQEARKVLVNDLRGTLFAIAQDVKIQVEFNPAKVQAYRLIGYENRLLRDQDFNDDTKDAGEIGAGHTVTALYEIIPTGIESPVKLPSVDPLKYQQTRTTATVTSNELMQVKLRYKAPNASTSQLISQTILDRDSSPESASANLKFSSAVAMYGMLLRDSDLKGTASFDAVLQLARQATGSDRFGYRTEFIRLVERSKPLLAKQKRTEQANRE